MNAKEIVLHDIKSGIKKYLKENIIIQPNFVDKRDITVFSIESKHTITGIDKTSDYRTKFSEIDNASNYLCALNDGALVQVKYVFRMQGKSNNLQEASLVYLPSPRECVELENGVQGRDIAFQNMRNYIRIDMNEDKKTYSRISHPKAHMHIGLYNDFRIGLCRIPLFTEFIQIILYLNYPDIWKSKFMNDEDMNQFVKDFIRNRDKNIITQDSCLLDIEKNFISMTI